MCDGGDMDGYEPPELLWHRIRRRLPEVEWDEAMRLLGSSLIDDNEMMHVEIVTLLDMWRELIDMSSVMENKLSERPLPRRRRGPEGDVTSMLTKEIQFFIDALEKRKGADLASVLHTPRERHVVNFVRKIDDEKKPATPRASRPQSARSSRGLATPRKSNNDRSVTSSPTEPQVSSIVDMEHVVAPLKDAFRAEKDVLLGDIAFLHEELSTAADYHSNLEGMVREQEDKPAPSLYELREVGTKLQDEFLRGEDDPSLRTVLPPRNKRRMPTKEPSGPLRRMARPPPKRGDHPSPALPNRGGRRSDREVVAGDLRSNRSRPPGSPVPPRNREKALPMRRTRPSSAQRLRGLVDSQRQGQG